MAPITFLLRSVYVRIVFKSNDCNLNNSRRFIEYTFLLIYCISSDPSVKLKRYINAINVTLFVYLDN